MVSSRDRAAILFDIWRSKCLVNTRPMPNVMAALPSIGGAICESSVIPFLVPQAWVTNGSSSGLKFFKIILFQHGTTSKWNEIILAAKIILLHCIRGSMFK